MKRHSKSKRGRNTDDHSMTALVIGTLGIVFANIGTSPLFAFRECFSGPHAVAPDQANILGILSLIFWSIALVVVLKYLTVIMQANNKGEGGIVALMAMLMQKSTPGHRPVSVDKVIMIGLFGAALMYGDGIITPAITVLSAIEGLAVADVRFQQYVVPLTVGLLMGLFLLQYKGVSGKGKLLGWVILVWFASITAIAVPWIILQPQVLFAVNPLFAVQFFAAHGFHGLIVLAAVILCITGAESLYAGVGHFGVRPIRIGWYALVFPALILNYFGQGALLLVKGPAAAANPFFGLVPADFLYPMVLIATSAAVVASQALISTAYALSQQIMQLGFLPRLSVVHTSAKTEGQIYVPWVNNLLMIACVGLVLIFKHSSGLATAYGLAVTGTMTITTVLFYLVSRQVWEWPAAPALLVAGFFLVFDLAFFGANLVKVHEGGWIPLLIAALVYLLMSTWQRGRASLATSMLSRSVPLSDFMARVETEKPHRVKGTAVFMTPNVDVAPIVLLHHFKHNQVLHEKILILTVQTKKVPFVKFEEHGRLTDLGSGFSKIIAKYGFMEQPSVLEILACGGITSDDVDEGNVSFFLGRETLLTTGGSPLSSLQKRVFAFLSRNAQSASVYYRVPPDHVIELGSQLEL